jgi:hypothetical protein
VSPSPTSPRLRSPELHPRSPTSNPHVREDRRTPRSKMARSPRSPASHRPWPTRVTSGYMRTQVSARQTPGRGLRALRPPHRGIERAANNAEGSQARTPRCGCWTPKARRAVLCAFRAYLRGTGRCLPSPPPKVEPSPATRHSYSVYASSVNRPSTRGAVSGGFHRRLSHLFSLSSSLTSRECRRTWRSARAAKACRLRRVAAYG